MPNIVCAVQNAYVKEISMVDIGWQEHFQSVLFYISWTLYHNSVSSQ